MKYTSPIEKTQKVHVRTRGKCKYTAGTNMNGERLLENIQATIKLIQHFLKKKELNNK